ncbi:OVARIAN TUMOR DOMAIN-containing deubiquitinating enzyme 1 [Curcuma longa]|uniref:OVARIAN TUMOR DOMAIN-containing deubiquitinating enzyme 1 n=1 Tax=Curcuma longa TaxID=136217 RepID=UPI003D9EE94E
MAAEAEASVRKRKAGEDADPGSGSGVDVEAVDSATPEPPSTVEIPKSSDDTTFNSNPNPSESFLFEDEYGYSCSCVDDGDIMKQYTDIRAVEAAKIPYLGDKEPLSSLAAEFQSGSPILQEKIKLLGEQYAAIRRTRGDGNCFYRGFMYSYLEHILDTQDKAEVDRVLSNIEQCRKTLQFLGYADFTFEDFFSIFIEQLESVLQGSETSISHEELLKRSRDQSISDYVVMFFRFVTAGEIRRRAEFFEPFVAGLSNMSVNQFVKASVEPMGEESDHVHIIALSDALGVPIRVVYLDRSSCDSSSPTINHHDFIPSSSSSSSSASDHPTKPVTLLYRPGHYDILYPN